MQVSEDTAVPPAERVKDLWSELIHTLRVRLDRLQGSSNTMQRRRAAFLQIWREGPFLTRTSGSVR
eukprot:c30186_g1_i1 orf=131-328(+)